MKNRKDIMSRAHAIRIQTGCDMGKALKASWAEFKAQEAMANGVVEETTPEKASWKEGIKTAREEWQQLAVVKNKVTADKVTYFKIGTGEFLSVQEAKTCTERLGAILSLDKTMVQVEASSLQDFHGEIKYITMKEKEELKPFLLTNAESSYAKTLLHKDTPVIDGRVGMMVELGGIRPAIMFATNQEFVRTRYINLDAMKKISLVPGYAGPGHKRKGDHQLVSEDLNHYTYVDGLGLDLESFGKQTIYEDEIFVKYAGKKINTRVLLSGSSAKLVPLFKGYKYVETHKRPYAYVDGTTIDGEIHLFVNEKTGDKKSVLVMPEDFTVEMAVETFGSVFSGETADFGKFQAEVKKVATDGTGYISTEWAKSVGLINSFTFRFTPVTKGLMQIVPELESWADADMILFGGAVKADVKPYFRKNQLDFGVIMHARIKDSKLLSFSRQAVKRLFGEELTDKYIGLTGHILEGVINLDMPTVRAFLSIGQDLSEEELEETEVEDMTVLHYFWANEDAFLQEGVLRNRLRNFLKKQIEKYVNGERVIIDDAVWRHMVVDPFTVIRHLNQGKMSVKAEDISIGLRKNRTFTVTDNFRVDSRETVLVRFPIVHKMEAQKTNISNESSFMDKDSEKYYNKYVEYFRGMVIFSLVDMLPEGMGGADFDGDTCIVIFNRTIVSGINKTDIFLDMSVVDGKVVSGAPFEDVTPINFEYLSKKERAWAEKNGVVFSDNGDILVPKGIEDDPEILRVVWKAIASVSFEGLQPGYVGMFTNISDTVVEYMTTVTNAEEYAKLDRLNSYLTAAVRWEIDKAKHGGAFLEALPFLNLILHGTYSYSEIARLEERFEIILRPFFTLRKSGKYRFTMSRSLFYGEGKHRENRLFIDSLEHRYIIEHTERFNNMFQIVMGKENSLEFNLYVYAKEIVQEGLATGKLLPETVDAFNWKTVSENGHNDKTKYLGLVIDLTRELKNIRGKCKDNIILQEEADMRSSKLRKQALEIASSWDSKDNGRYIMAMIYLAIANDQFTKGGKTQGFRMSNLSDAFSLFPRETIQFLQACKTVKGVPAKEGTEVRFLMNADYQVSVAEKLVLGHGRVNAVINNKLERIALVNLRDIKEGKALTGVLKVTKVEITKNGNTVIVGKYVNYKK